MKSAKVNVHELIAWGLDEYPYRDTGTDLGQKELAKQVEQAQHEINSTRALFYLPRFVGE